jgi:hypothetical protein
MTNVTLVLPPGANDAAISHGTMDYQPEAYRLDHTDRNSERRIELPPHVAAPLLHRGGFYVAPTSYVVHSQGSIRMRHKDGPRSCGWGGIAFEPDEDGVIEVPVEAIADLQSHGFESAPPKELVEPPVEDEAEEAPKKKGKAPAKEAQLTDAGGHHWPKDEEGTEHPDEPAKA